MLDSILNGRKKSNQSTSIASVSIEISPDFGWPLGSERVFGPGTLFQGYVVVKCNASSIKATRLRMHFQGVEAMLAYDVGPGVIRTQSNQLFGVRHTLWKRTEEEEEEEDYLVPGITYKFLFTVQMPLVQFPPSMHHDYYRCTYKLAAYLDPSLGYGEVPVMSHSYINYIPLIETKLLKAPLVLPDLKRKSKYSIAMAALPSVSLQLNSIEYQSGDAIHATVCLMAADCSLSRFDYHVTMNLYQTSTFFADSVPVLTQLIDTQSEELVVSKNSSSEKKYPISMKLKENLPPSFEYSRIMALTYNLKIKVYIKRKRSSSSSSPSPGTAKTNGNSSNKKLKGMISSLASLPSSTTMSVFETPVVIGTLSRGIRVGEDLQEYSSLKSSNAVPVVPKFLKNLQHEDELPKYEPARLPCYSETNANAADHQYQQPLTISAIVSASPVTVVRSSL